MPVEYTTIYVEPFLKAEKRNVFNGFITDSSIFLPRLIYEPDNPNFGVQNKIKMVLEYGIEKKNLEDYVPVLSQNFYRKRLIFGDVKVAIAKDSTGTHLYDVVYVEIIDDMDGVRPSVNINNVEYYPSSIENMRNRFVNSGFLFDDNLTPRFMKTIQTGEDRPADYVKAVILCYTLPSQGTKIYRRIKKSKFNFTQFDFEIDRIIVQDSLDNLTAKYVVFSQRTITDGVQ